MNSIRQIRELNKRELENGVSTEASWHADYRDTAYVYIGGLPFELSEGDVITIFSQYGEPTYINLVRDKDTGKSRGFAFLKYEDQRSTDLAVDNLGGAVVMGRTLRVDHTRYKKKDDEAETGMDLTKDLERLGSEDGDGSRKRRKTDESESEEERRMLREEIELAKLIQNHDEDDPMKQFLIEEKKEEVALALARVKDVSKPKKSSHKHRHHHRSGREKGDGDGRGNRNDGERSSNRGNEVRQRRRSRSRQERDRESDAGYGRRREESSERRHRRRRDS